jgi:hypothetical protein
MSDLAITLTVEEQGLASSIDFDRASGPYNPDAMEELMNSLLGRDAIPTPRWSFFTDPYIGGHGKSHLEVFEGNGTRGRDIFRHPHFEQYLRYFIYGPKLRIPEDGDQRSEVMAIMIPK